MRNLKSVLIIPAVLFLLMTIGCDNENDGNALAQPAPMSGTDVTGKLNPASEQTCPILIGGLTAGDTIIVELESTGDMTGDATITNSTTNTSAKCSGNTEATLPPAEVMSCKVSSSNISGIKVDDEMEISLGFTSQTKEVSLASISGTTGITCGFVTIETLNAIN